METNDKKGMARREFLKRLGVGTAATAAALTGCDSRRNAATGDHTAQGEIPTDRMTYRINPKTGEQVSLLGYGCMRWPTLSGGSARDGADEIDQEEVNRLVDFAIAHGVNYFDTSPAYCKGRSERATGIALKRHPRESYYIATKLSNFAPSTWSREASMAMYRNSFKELQVDRIDYLLLHGVGMGGGMKEFEARYIDNGILDFLLSEREAGRIRNLGFSYHGDIAVFDRLLAEHDRYRWDFVQIQLNYVDWRHAKEVNTRNTDAEYLYGELSRRGIPAVIMEPLLGGRLSNVHDHIAAKLRQRRPEQSVASWAFRFAGSFPGVLTVLSGMTYMGHNDRKYRMPCPYGLDIPGILLHFNKCINEGRMPSSSRDSAYRQARRAFLVGYDRSVPRLRQADHCIGCNQCVPHCPQNIDIPAQMQRIDRFVEDLKQNREF